MFLLVSRVVIAIIAANAAAELLVTGLLPVTGTIRRISDSIY